MMETVTEEANSHLQGARLEHKNRTLGDEPTARADLARMRLTTDTTRTLLADTISAIASGREEAQLRVLEVKAVAAEAATEVIDYEPVVGNLLPAPVTLFFLFGVLVIVASSISAAAPIIRP
jgi:alkylation response protein AidB-like acyl-CoA dehydrogenase